MPTDEFRRTGLSVSNILPYLGFIADQIQAFVMCKRVSKDFISRSAGVKSTVERNTSSFCFLKAELLRTELKEVYI